MKDTKGSVMLETSIFLPLFIFLFLFLFGLFSIVIAQNEVNHALIQSSKSVSLDPYLAEHVDSIEESKEFWSNFGSMFLDIVRSSNDAHFSSSSDWYETGSGASTVVKDRFVGYISGGDENKANEKLKKLGVENGLNGILFISNINDGNIETTIKYNLKFWFNIFDIGKIPMEQTIVSKLWGV